MLGHATEQAFARRDTIIGEPARRELVRLHVTISSVVNTLHTSTRLPRYCHRAPLAGSIFAGHKKAAPELTGAAKVRPNVLGGGGEESRDQVAKLGKLNARLVGKCDTGFIRFHY